MSVVVMVTTELGGVSFRNVFSNGPRLLVGHTRACGLVYLSSRLNEGSVVSEPRLITITLSSLIVGGGRLIVLPFPAILAITVAVSIALAVAIGGFGGFGSLLALVRGFSIIGNGFFEFDIPISSV